MGVSQRVIAETFEALLAIRVKRQDHLDAVMGPMDPELRTPVDEEVEAWRSLTWNSWVSKLRNAISRGDEVHPVGPRKSLGTASRLMEHWDYADPRFILRSVLEAVPDEEQIILDLHDVIDGGWLKPPYDPQAIGRRHLLESSQALLPPVILTEGRFDTEVLSSALELTRPHLKRFLTFPDFSHKNEGGAASLRQTLRAFASSGIPNRVVALFDNDTAARDVLRSIREDELPPNIRIACLPHLDLATKYPTVGPQGEQFMDVNGLAASIELYLGKDALQDVTGELIPVQWGGYNKALSSYQGDLLNKKEAQENFRKKLMHAREEPEALRAQDWSGVDLILDHILQLVSDMSQAPSLEVD